jgi:hypothetical protein
VPTEVLGSVKLPLFAYLGKVYRVDLMTKETRIGSLSFNLKRSLF